MSPIQAENYWHCCCCGIVCAIILFSALTFTFGDNEKCTANETTEHCLASCYILCVRATPKCECTCTLWVCFCVSNCFLCFFWLRLFSSYSLRPTFWCHFRVSLVLNWSNYRYRWHDRFSTCAPKIAKCIRTHTHARMHTFYIPNFLELFATFSVSTFSLLKEPPKQFHEKYFNSVYSFALLQRAFNEFCWMFLFSTLFVCVFLLVSACMLSFVRVIEWANECERANMYMSHFWSDVCLHSHLFGGRCERQQQQQSKNAHFSLVACCLFCYFSSIFRSRILFVGACVRVCTAYVYTDQWFYDLSFFLFPTLFTLHSATECWDKGFTWKKD